ncbi:hypothetical protein [Hymenobacter metallicola]|uniref:Uncharacterized protein n=1 Tax=Hymenobacter metallicola TaxID=2563114 RepID=A0A4Z0QHB1_9BACT|nr:hypothetical protein [Hymenobacter metallicola]TGE29458.1 hypothetical protein E5K02_08395 [Hymenobacter metallicola]
MKEKIVRVTGYGFFCLSVEAFSNFLKEHKIKAKKLNTYFDKNRDILEESIKQGILLPLSTIVSTRYVVEAGIAAKLSVFDSDWQEVLTLDNCNLTVGNDAAIWIGSLDGLDDWNSAEYEQGDSISYQTMDGVTLFRSFKFNVKPGMYKVVVRGFKRKAPQDHPAANFGFSFELRETTSLGSFTNPLIENVNIAKM